MMSPDEAFCVLPEEVAALFFKKQIFLALPWGLWDLSSLTRDGTHAFWIKGWNLNCWTAREVPKTSQCWFYLYFLKYFGHAPEYVGS